jgi:hypothetical protein
LVLCRLAIGINIATLKRNGMIVVSPTGEPVENPLVIGIGIAYVVFLVAYVWWNNRKKK